ncbi:MAG: ABC transporter permease [Terriglobales bacterium]
MRNIWLVIRREYKERVRTKGFIISTLLFPALILGITLLPAKIAGSRSSGSRHIAVVSDNADFAAAVKTQLQSDKKSKYTVDVYTGTSDQTRARLKQAVNDGKLDGFVWLSQQDVDARKVNYYARETSDFIELATLQSALRTALLRNELLKRGVSTAEADKLTNQLDLEAITLKAGQEKKTNGEGEFMLAFVMVMAIYMTTLIYGMMVMRSVLEEKTSRVMEVVLSSAKATELMAGKILGVGAVGLTQIAIWLVIAAGASAPSLLAMAGAKDAGIHLDPMILAAFAVFFIGGYLLYSTMYAALASMVNSEQEAQQWQMFVTLPLIVPMVMWFVVMRQPNAPLSIWMSMIPFFSPILMFLRIVVQTPPMWQIALSIGLLAAFTAGIIWLCARIYRVGILMYGKRPTLPEIVKWVRYA